jgi:hypothetical protein
LRLKKLGQCKKIAITVPKPIFGPIKALFGHFKPEKPQLLAPKDH